MITYVLYKYAQYTNKIGGISTLILWNVYKTLFTDFPIFIMQLVFIYRKDRAIFSIIMILVFFVNLSVGIFNFVLLFT